MDKKANIKKQSVFTDSVSPLLHHYQEKLERHLNNTQALSWCLKAPESFQAGYTKMSEIGFSWTQRFANQYLSRYIPIIQEHICRTIGQNILSTYDENRLKLGQNSRSLELSFKQYVLAIQHTLQDNYSLIHKWPFAHCASFLQASINHFLKEVIHSPTPDLFLSDKQLHNSHHIQLYSELREQFLSEQLSLKQCCYLAAKANTIDSYEKNATEFSSHFPEEVVECMDKPDWLEELIEFLPFFDYRSLIYDIEGKTKHFLYECDNHGEIFYDFLLIELLLQKGHSVTIAAKESPILNDVSIKDLNILFKSPELSHFKPYLNSNQLKSISNGSSDVIKLLYEVSDSYKEAYTEADCILSKGQGHFESYPQYYFHLGLKKKHEYKNNHLFLFTLKSSLIQQSLKRIHKKKYEKGLLIMQYVGRKKES